MLRGFQLLGETPIEQLEESAALPEQDGDAFVIKREDDGTFVITGKNIEKLVAMTNFDNYEGMRRFQYIWRHIGIEKALRERGVQEGNSVRIADMLFEFKE
jgi:GTP-binding protein